MKIWPHLKRDMRTWENYLTKKWLSIIAYKTKYQKPKTCHWWTFEEMFHQSQNPETGGNDWPCWPKHSEEPALPYSTCSIGFEGNGWHSYSPFDRILTKRRNNLSTSFHGSTRAPRSTTVSHNEDFSSPGVYTRLFKLLIPACADKRAGRLLPSGNCKQSCSTAVSGCDNLLNTDNVFTWMTLAQSQVSWSDP